MRARIFAVVALALFAGYTFSFPAVAVVIPTGAVPGASVDFGGPVSGSSSTDSSGNYNTQSLYVAGSYNLSAGATGFITAHYPSLTVVTLGHSTTGVDFNLERSSIVAGRVTGPGGVPVAGATVDLQLNGTSNVVGSDTTTSDGRYAIETNVAAGLYQIEVTPPTSGGFFGLGFNCLSFSSVCPDSPSYAPGFMGKTVVGINVGALALVTQDIQLSSSAAIVGSVTFNSHGVSGVMVSVNGSCSSCFAVTNSTGGFMISNDLPGGTYNVTLSTSFFSTLSAHVIAKGSKVVSVSAGHVATADFTLAASAVVSGYVKDSGNNPVRGATVSIGTQSCIFTYCYLSCGNNSFFPCATNTTDASGHYTLETNIGSGSYNVTATKGSEKEGLSSLLSVTAGGSVTAPLITLNPSGTEGTPTHITGTVEDNLGHAVPYAQVTGEGITSHISGYTSANAEGQFDIVLNMTSTESVNVSASATGFTSAFHVVLSVVPGSSVSAGTLTLMAISPASISGNVQGEMISTLVSPQRTQKWETQTGAIITTRTDSEFTFGFSGGLSLSGNTIQALVDGPHGTTGTFTIAIPVSLISAASWSVTVDGSPVSFTSGGNTTYTLLTVTYSHTSHILEFSPASTSTTTSQSTTSTSSSATTSTSSSTASSSTSSSTTTTHTASQVTSSSHSSTSAGQTSTSKSSSSGGGGGIPEYPYQLGPVALLTLLVVASYLMVRRRSSPGSSAGPAIR